MAEHVCLCLSLSKDMMMALQLKRMADVGSVCVCSPAIRRWKRDVARTHTHTVRLLPSGLLYNPVVPIDPHAGLSVSIRFHLLVPSLSLVWSVPFSRSVTHTQNIPLFVNLSPHEIFVVSLKGRFPCHFLGCVFLTRERESLIDPTHFSNTPFLQQNGRHRSFTPKSNPPPHTKV
jgi:hypothetical protein